MNETIHLPFQTSVKKYNLNGTCEVEFSPTDSFFAERLFRVFDSLQGKQEEYEKEVQSAAGKREIFEISRARDAEMRQMIDDVFGHEVCNSLFPGRSVYSMAGGLPEWCNLMLALIDEMDESLVTEQKASNPRVKKYTDKYAKYQKMQK